jgi:hypothetical protein
MSDFEAIMQAAKGTTEPVKTARRSNKVISVDALLESKADNVRLNLDIPKQTDEKLKQVAKKLKITKSALVRRLVDALLENVE